MEYTVYVIHGEVCVAEAAGVIPPALPDGAQVLLVTTSQDDAVDAIGQAVLEGYEWAGCDWLGPAQFHCDKCQRPAERDGQERYDGYIALYREAVAAADALHWWRVLARAALMREAGQHLASAHEVCLEYCALTEEARGQ